MALGFSAVQRNTRTRATVWKTRAHLPTYVKRGSHSGCQLVGPQLDNEVAPMCQTQCVRRAQDSGFI